MTEITKLKQEAEEARQKVIANSAKYGLQYPEEFISLLFDAHVKQIALQAAEKEAEAKRSISERDAKEYEYQMQQEKRHYEDRVRANPECYPAPIADDAWIKWEGGECPIPGIENWEWKGRDGRISKEVKYLAERLRWRHCDSCSDIIAYRIISPAAVVI